MKRTLLAVLLMCSVAGVALAGEFFRSEEPVPGMYFVQLKDNVGIPSSAIAKGLAGQHGVAITHVYSRTLQGFAFQGHETAAKALARSPHVEYVREATYGHLTATQTPAGSIGLDRIDQRLLAPDNNYTYNETGTGTRIYIIDSGVNNVPELTGRIVYAQNFVTGEQRTDDCFNHGTSVATIAAGTVHGVAKGASIINYRVSACSGLISSNDMVAAIDSVSALPGERVVVNISSRLPGNVLEVNRAVRSLNGRGIAVVASAPVYLVGDPRNACSDSPSQAGVDLGIMTVSSVSNDSLWEVSTPNGQANASGGPCVDLFAPTDIAASNAAGAEIVFSGTSASAPLVTGVAALVLQRNPGLAGNAGGVEIEVVGNTTQDILSFLPPQTPNRLLHSLPTIFVTAPPAAYPSELTTASVQPASGATYQWTITGGTLVSGQGTPSVTFKPGCFGVVRVEARVSTAAASSTGLAKIAIAEPSARVSGSAWITAGESATIEASLRGVGPWTLLWSDNVLQSGITGSLAQRTVSPTETTDYWLITATDGGNCNASRSGWATVTVSQ